MAQKAQLKKTNNFPGEQRNAELNWPFLIKVDYKTDTMVKFLENLFENKIAVLFNGYDAIIKNYNINKIGGQYINLILTKQDENYENRK